MEPPHLPDTPGPVAVALRATALVPRPLTRRGPEVLGPLLPSQGHPSPVRVAVAVEHETVGERQLAVAALVVQETSETELRVLLIQVVVVAGARSIAVSAQAKVLAAGVVL